MEQKPSSRIKEAGEKVEFLSLKEMPDSNVYPKLSVVNRLYGELEEIKKILDEMYEKFKPKE